MRIIAGQFRGLRLASVGKGDRAAHLRPTADRVRESLFSILMGGAYGDPITGARVLDLFAGTGALGLEALSRGADTLLLVDDGRTSAALIAENIALTRSADRARLLRRDATRLGPNDEPPFDLIFLDPPYARDMGKRALVAAQAGNWLAPDALVVWEESTPQEAPEGFRLLDRRRYGDTHITMLAAPGGEADQTV